MPNLGIVKIGDTRVGKMVPYVYDYITFNPASQPTTIIFKSGGEDGTIVATLNFVYDGSDVLSITRT
jgi:hypothetical protein